MKKISLILSIIAFASFVAITPVSAQKVTPKKATTAQVTSAPAKKACCANANGKCTMAKNGKTCTNMKKTTASVAPKAK